MGYKFEPTLTYTQLGEGKIRVFFQWQKKNVDNIIFDLDAFNELRLFAETIDLEKRMHHLANAINWHERKDDSDFSALVFCINLLYYFPWNKVITLKRKEEEKTK